MVPKLGVPKRQPAAAGRIQTVVIGFTHVKNALDVGPFDGRQFVEHEVQLLRIEVKHVDQPQIGQIIHRIQRPQVGDVDKVHAAEVQFRDGGKIADSLGPRVAAVQQRRQGRLVQHGVLQ